MTAFTDDRPDIFDVHARRVLVTGGLSGLGAAIVDEFLARGASVSVLDLPARASSERAQEFLARGARIIVGDVADRAVIEVIRDEISELGGLDVLFANAGVSGGYGPLAAEPHAIALEEIDWGRWQRTLEVNLNGVIHTVQAVSPTFKKQRSGKVVVTASAAGIFAAPSIAYSYTAAKAGVVGLIRELAFEFARYGVTVNGFAPGVFLTNINDGRFHEAGKAEAAGKGVPLGRIAQASEIVGAALLFASEASSYITGVILPVDGGQTAGTSE